MAVNITGIKDEGGAMGHNSKAKKTETAKDAAANAPHSSQVKAILRGEAQDTGGVSGQRLKAFVERIERMNEEIGGLMEDRNDIFAEAKAVGFDAKIMRKVIMLRKMDKEKRVEEQELLDLYKSAIGME